MVSANYSANSTSFPVHFTESPMRSQIGDEPVSNLPNPQQFETSEKPIHVERRVVHIQDQHITDSILRIESLKPETIENSSFYEPRALKLIKPNLGILLIHKRPERTFYSLLFPRSLSKEIASAKPKLIQLIEAEKNIKKDSKDQQRLNACEFSEMSSQDVESIKKLIQDNDNIINELYTNNFPIEIVKLVMNQLKENAKKTPAVDLSWEYVIKLTDEHTVTFTKPLELSEDVIKKIAVNAFKILSVKLNPNADVKEAHATAAGSMEATASSKESAAAATSKKSTSDKEAAASKENVAKTPINRTPRTRSSRPQSTLAAYATPSTGQNLTPRMTSSWGANLTPRATPSFNAVSTSAASPTNPQPSLASAQGGALPSGASAGSAAAKKPDSRSPSSKYDTITPQPSRSNNSKNSDNLPTIPSTTASCDCNCIIM